MQDALVSFGTSPYRKNLASCAFAAAHRAFLDAHDIRRSGSAALDIAYIAAGRADAFFEPYLRQWDYAAGSILLTEAGGCVSNWSSQELPLDAGDSVVACANRELHAYFIDMLASCSDAAPLAGEQPMQQQ